MRIRLRVRVVVRERLRRAVCAELPCRYLDDTLAHRPGFDIAKLRSCGVVFGARERVGPDGTPLRRARPIPNNLSHTDLMDAAKDARLHVMTRAQLRTVTDLPSPRRTYLEAIHSSKATASARKADAFRTFRGRTTPYHRVSPTDSQRGTSMITLPDPQPRRLPEFDELRQPLSVLPVPAEPCLRAGDLGSNKPNLGPKPNSTICIVR